MKEAAVWSASSDTTQFPSDYFFRALAELVLDN